MLLLAFLAQGTQSPKNLADLKLRTCCLRGGLVTPENGAIHSRERKLVEDSTAKGKVSIVIPCYNCGSMLPETLASIEQVRSDVIAEVIVVNDGSNDETTCRIIQDLDAGKYKVIHQANRGLASARNAGIKVARGEFILPLDSDDLIRQVYFDQGVAILLDYPEVGGVYGDAEYFGEKGGRWKLPEFDLRSLVMGNYITACTLFRRSAWGSVGGYDEKMRIGRMGGLGILDARGATGLEVRPP
jgi:glycosyltransferase involved in cell wall biosynthesis